MLSLRSIWREAGVRLAQPQAWRVSGPSGLKFLRIPPGFGGLFKLESGCDREVS